jgi:hypothetical protein
MNFSKIFKVRDLKPGKPKFNTLTHKNKILYRATNCDDEKFLFSVNEIGNKFIGTYFMAYINHGNAIFSPSDLWYIIALSYSRYANDNVDIVKKYINPDFIGNKETLKIYINDNDWFNAINNMVLNIKNSSYDNNFVDILENNFLSASPVEKLASNIAIMKTTEKFYEYEFESLCGFNHIKLIGELDDWMLLKNKTEQLSNYGCEKWKLYISNVVTIIDEFINCFTSSPNITFFEKIIIAEYNHSSYESYDTLSGWILDLFYGFNKKYSTTDVPDLFASVPAKYDNENITIQSGYIGCEIKYIDCKYNNLDPSINYTLTNKNLYVENPKQIEITIDTMVGDVTKIVDEDHKIKSFDSNNTKSLVMSDVIYDFRPVVACTVKKSTK